jgi:hypothetical protein
MSHKDYAYEKYTNRDHNPYEHKQITQEELKTPVGPLRNEYKLSIPSIRELVEGHPAKAYIVNRKIPEKYWSELYFAENYKDFLDRDFPGRASEEVLNDQRLVLPFINKDNYITYVTGRSLAAYSKHDLRYITVKILEQKKVFGENRLVDNSPVYVTEGPIDSLFLPNAVASGDANLFGVADYLHRKGHTDITLVYDNEPRNKPIVRQMEKAIDAGYKIVIQPHGVSKDLNLLATEGWSFEKIHSYIQKHTYQGPMASLTIAGWRRTQ